MITDEHSWKAKLQLRPKNETLYKFVIKQIEKNNITITKQEKLKEGFDVFITSAPFAMSLGKLFKKQFKGTVKVTRSLTGEDNYGRIYKLTVLLRMPE